jgi:hypothetical protein
MALRDLLDAIEAEAAAETSRLRHDRHRQADAIISEAHREARDLKVAALATAENEERGAGELRLAAARRANAARLLDTREAAYAEIVQEARLRVEPMLRCAGGVEVADGRGGRVRNTLEERFTAAEPVLRALVGRLLDGADSQPLPGHRASPDPEVREVLA